MAITPYQLRLQVITYSTHGAYCYGENTGRICKQPGESEKEWAPEAHRGHPVCDMEELAASSLAFRRGGAVLPDGVRRSPT